MPQNKAGVGPRNIPERNRRRHVVWFQLRCDFCPFAGFGNALRTVKTRAPKVRSFSGPKNERTRWAPIRMQRDRDIAQHNIHTKIEEMWSIRSLASIPSISHVQILDSSFDGEPENVTK